MTATLTAFTAFTFRHFFTIWRLFGLCEDSTEVINYKEGFYGDLMMKRDGMGLLQLLEYPDVIPSATNFYKLKKTNEHTNSVYSEFSTLKSS